MIASGTGCLFVMVLLLIRPVHGTGRLPGGLGSRSLRVLRTAAGRAMTRFTRRRCRFVAVMLQCAGPVGTGSAAAASAPEVRQFAGNRAAAGGRPKDVAVMQVLMACQRPMLRRHG